MAVRYRTEAGSDNGGTVTFTQTEPLPSGYVLLAFMYRNQGSTLPTPSGWTKISENSIATNYRVAAYVRRSDGVVNSFPGTGANANWRSTLLAYESAEANTHQSGLFGAGASTTSSSSISTTASVSTSVYGVTVAHFNAGTATSSRVWGGGFSEAHQSSSLVAIGERIGGPATFTPSVSWSQNISIKNITAVHIPLAVPETPDSLDYFAWDGEEFIPLDLLGSVGT